VAALGRAPRRDERQARSDRFDRFDRFEALDLDGTPTIELRANREEG
jgi:hypothetical protein